MSKKTKYYSVKELFHSDNYIIPIYQRNYAWGESEITQLIQDIVDYCKKDRNSNYYIGSLITYERRVDGKTFFEIIDGQQRLTTLTILLNFIRNEGLVSDIDFYKKLNLSFDSRPLSTNTLQNLFSGEKIEGKEYNIEIKQGYDIVKKTFKRIIDEFSLPFDEFCSYLFDKVMILRVLVPEDTDLNHYFEIMNSRGEQLEKHEVLKAKMLEILDKEDRYAFNLIWEACSNMEKYVQYGFNIEQRNVIFGNSDDNKWNVLSDMAEIYESLANKRESQIKEPESISITNLLKPNANQNSENKNNDEDSPERFNTIINFSNFLLHILRIQTVADIPLDDKGLIEQFDKFLKDENEETNKGFVKQFGYNLLKGKFLLDKYIIKREFAKGTDHWSLKRLKCYGQEKNKNVVSYINTFGEEDSNNDINREILMLLSMFHVSTPTLVYKHWLNAALKYLFETSETQDFSALAYKEYLEELARTFLYDRFLANKPKDYFEMIYINQGELRNIEKEDIDLEKLDKGTEVENFIFNYLDYILWKNYRTEDKLYFKAKFKGNDETLITLDNRILDFEYTFRSSVEHYYPQNPIEGNPPIAREWLDNFGNLCLISGYKNSRLNNYMPIAKKNHYNNSLNIDSIKQRIMMEYTNWFIADEYNTNQIKDHGDKMKEILLLSSGIIIV